MSVILGATAFAWQTFRPSAQPLVGDPSELRTRVEVELSVRAIGRSSAPSGVLNVEEVAVSGMPESYSWREGNTMSYTDVAVPNFAPEDFLEVPLPADLVVSGDAADSSASLQQPGTFPFDSVAALGDAEHPTSMGTQRGRLVLQIAAQWPQGNVTYYFPIDLVGASSVEPRSQSTPGG